MKKMIISSYELSKIATVRSNGESLELAIIGEKLGSSLIVSFDGKCIEVPTTLKYKIKEEYKK